MRHIPIVILFVCLLCCSMLLHNDDPTSDNPVFINISCDGRTQPSYFTTGEKDGDTFVKKYILSLAHRDLSRPGKKFLVMTMHFGETTEHFPDQLISTLMTCLSKDVAPEERGSHHQKLLLGKSHLVSLTLDISRSLVTCLGRSDYFVGDDSSIKYQMNKGKKPVEIRRHATTIGKHVVVQGKLAVESDQLKHLKNIRCILRVQAASGTSTNVEYVPTLQMLVAYIAGAVAFLGACTYFAVNGIYHLYLVCSYNLETRERDRNREEIALQARMA